MAQWRKVESYTIAEECTCILISGMWTIQCYIVYGHHEFEKPAQTNNSYSIHVTKNAEASAALQKNILIFDTLVCLLTVSFSYKSTCGH